MQYELYSVIVNGSTQWRWRLRAANQRILASGESYFNRQDCIDTVYQIMDTNRQTTFVEVSS